MGPGRAHLRRGPGPPPLVPGALILGALWWVLVVSWFCTICALPNTVRLGIVIGENEAELEKDILLILESLNLNDTILPYSKLVPRVVRIKREDQFHAHKSVCNLSSEGLVALVGSPSSSVNTMLQSSAQALRLPHLEVTPGLRSVAVNFSVNLFPDPEIFSKALMDLVGAKNWKSFTVVYEDHEGILRLEDLYNSGYNVRIRRLSREEHLKKVFKELGQQGETHIILDIPIQRVVTVFQEIQDLGMLTEYHNYIVTSLDFHTVPMEDFRHGLSNISGFHFLRSGHLDNPEGDRPLPHRVRYGARMKRLPSFPTRTAVLYDTLTLLARALQDLDNSQTLHDERVSCRYHKHWSQGTSVVNYMKMINIVGTTGIVKLDGHGRRVDFDLDVVEVKKKGLRKVGSWTIRSGFTSVSSPHAVYNEVLHSLRNRTLRVTTLISPPYTMVKENVQLPDARFHGYCVDLLHELSRALGFRFEIRLVRDNSYGILDERGEWNGMIRELVDRDADIAVGDLTITYQREEVVDFTMPFMNLGISILFKKPKRKQKNPFIFFSSLSLEVWLFTIGASVLASSMLYMTARFSPAEWVIQRTPKGEGRYLVNKFGFANCLWFTLSALMRQGSPITPRALSTRLAALSWWFFTLIMISSYTANFAAFLTAERLKLPIESVEDLARQTKIHYGCVSTGSTCSFFENSNIDLYRGMWEFMKSAQPSAFTQSNVEGVHRVINGSYAFLMESTSIEYITERNCDLMQVGGLLDSKGYGIAMPSGSPYTPVFSSTILRLQEDGTLQNLKNKWWRQKDVLVPCDNEYNATKVSINELGLYSVGGIFVVLLSGLGLGILVVTLEIIFKFRRGGGRTT